MKALNRREEEFGLSLTPLIDVVFLLIVFFLVSTSFVKPEKVIEILLPAADQARQAPGEQSGLTVNVRRSGVTVLGGRVIGDYDELVAAIRAAHEENPELTVNVCADKRALHEHVVRALNATLAAGVGNLSINVFETENDR